MTTEITFPGRVPGNNGKDGLMRMHHRKRLKLTEAYKMHIWRFTRYQHKGPVRVELTRYGYGVQPDNDNLVSTGKLLMDAFVLARVIIDDKPAIIVEPIYSFKRVGKPSEQRTEIRITDVAPGTQQQPIKFSIA